MDEHKPHWMIDHELADKERFDVFEVTLNRIEKKLDPIANTYTSATTMGQWIMRMFVFISITVGVILGLKSLLK
jgi:hypothetical protein